MQSIIQLLPDSVANQIAAGEVVQRPASVVKELLENAIDAKATEIKLIVKDAGRTLVQVIDNGVGMNPTDARMSFERHATSKLKTADDLFNLNTKGFRGEALASIAAVAQVELKTRQLNTELGTQIIIEGSRIEKQEACATTEGTSIAVKNLFYNIPARRNFLKSNSVELKHILDELQRVALAHNQITFWCYHNDNLLYHLPAGKLKNRIISIFGTRFNDRLAPIEEITDVVKINGFIAKPEAAKKTRGEQFFFVNDRFIKHPYFHHAVNKAFEGLIKADEHPVYFIFLQVNPADIDVNIHPTKTEVKFSNEKIIYPILLAAVRRALGTHNFIPSLDFENDNFIHIPPPSTDSKPEAEPEVPINFDYNPFAEEKRQNASKNTGGGSFGFTPKPNTKASADNWHDLYKIAAETHFGSTQNETENEHQSSLFEETNFGVKAIELHSRYLFSQIKSGVVVVDKFRALERIFYDQMINRLSRNEVASQQILFPIEIDLRPEVFAAFCENEEVFIQMGFEISIFGKNNIVVNGLPEGLAHSSPEELIPEICDNLLNQKPTSKRDVYHTLASKLAVKMAYQNAKNLSSDEISGLIDKLFACEIPFHTPSGKATLFTLNLNELEQKFNN
jgi:DNA mismatch repair protein MutL